MKRLAISGFGVCLLLVGCADEAADANAAGAAPATDPLEGAWQVTEIVRSGPEATGVPSPRTGLRLFVDGQYTWLYINSDTLRAPLPPYDSATREELLTGIGPVFSANGGAYAVSGDTIRFALTVTKNPNLMGPDQFRSGTYRIAGDSLWITDVATNEGPATNPTIMKHVRLR